MKFVKKLYVWYIIIYYDLDQVLFPKSLGFQNFRINVLWYCQ